MNKQCLKIVCILACCMPFVVSGSDAKTTQQHHNKHIQNVGILFNAPPGPGGCTGPVFPPRAC